MTQPAYQILVYFGVDPYDPTIFVLDDPIRGLLNGVSVLGPGAGFILNDATRGVLDNVTYTAGGDVGTDVAAYAVTFDIDRGRPSIIFADIDAGTAVVQFNNEDRRFDPLYAAGPYYGSLKPGIRVVLSADAVVLFEGKVSGWDLSYDVSGRSVASMICEDGLATLARQQFEAWTATAAETAGTRLSAIINRPEVGWAGQVDLDAGVSILQGDSVAWGSNVLNYCQLVARSDGPAAFFASRRNTLTFRDRWSTLSAVSSASFGDDNIGIPVQGIAIESGSETYYTRVGVERAAGIAQSYTTAAAATQGVRSLPITGVLLNSDSQSLDMATYYATTYASGDARIASVTTIVDTAMMSVAMVALVLGIEINDLVTVRFTPNRVGAQISQACVVAGINHMAVPGGHSVTLRLSKWDNRAPFIIDSATNGLVNGLSVLIF